ncbi:MAG: hypothetical protein JNM89_08470 [Hyphomicrobiaceae bacterium]|nr:hypothetical protein [Hyphomicrobiaceae bacterium]
MSRLGMLAMVAAMPACLVAPATAAVRQCAAPVTGDVAEASTERESRRLALTSWQSKVAALGEGYKSWRLASVKRLSCSRTTTGTFRCAAFAAPCTIKQAPPKKRPLPAGRKPAIEA